MKTRRPIRITTVVTMLFPCFRLLSWPLDPVPLLNLVQKSDLIVLATVEAPNPEKLASGDPEAVLSVLRPKSPARLQPLIVLKGKAPAGQIAVVYEPNLVCPAPPFFPPGSNVLAFLEGGQGFSPGFRTVALSYGAKLLSKPEIESYTRQIRALAPILDERDSPERSRRITEWLVTCVEDPLTRWEGAASLYEGPGQSLGKVDKSEYVQYITAQQMGRLSNVLFSSEYMDHGELTLMELFRQQSKARLTAHLIQYLHRAAKVFPPTSKTVVVVEEMDAFPAPWNTFDVMHELAELVESAEAKAMMTNYVRTSFFHVNARVAAVNRFLPVIEQSAIRHRYIQPNQ